jgi:hypothetical protein
MALVMSIWKYILIFLTAVVILVIVILGLQKCEFNPQPSIKYDTIVKVVDRPVIRVDSIPAKVKWRTKYVSVPEYISILDTIHQKDTITRFVTQAFTACFDTVINRDTLSGEFDFPEFIFRNIEVKQHPDSIMTIIKTIQLPATFGQKLEYGLYSGVGGAILGGVLGLYLGK